MMKVNLLKTRVTPATATGYGDGGATTFTAMSEEISDGGSPIVKFLLLFVFLGLLMVFENQKHTERQSTAQATLQQALQLESQLESKRVEGEAATKAQTTYKELEQKLSALKTLSKTRTMEIKALDFLQSIIPERVWLTSMEYRDNKFSFQGYAVADNDMADFMKRLESRSYFKNVITTQSKDMKTDDGNVKFFEVSASMEER